MMGGGAVMALYLVQHGISLPKEQDPEKGLSQEGMEDVNRIAEVARGYGVPVKCIRHSGKKRARQTAELFASALHPEQGILESSGLNPLDDVTLYAERIRSDENLMLVGHLPFLERLTSFLITGSTETPVFRFQNGGIVCLEEDPERNTWVIKWTLMPKIG
jgi:phosphohistidine phosphatase